MQEQRPFDNLLQLSPLFRAAQVVQVAQVVQAVQAVQVAQECHMVPQVVQVVQVVQVDQAVQVVQDGLEVPVVAVVFEENLALVDLVVKSRDNEGAYDTIDLVKAPQSDVRIHTHPAVY